MKGRRINSVVSARGFTLIEVLVVVAIIALMAAILLPSLRAARDQARVTMCLTNLHDTGLALHQYSVEYDPYYPLKGYIGTKIYAYNRTPADDNLFVLWLKKMCPDLKTFTCPSTNHKIRKPFKINRVKVNASYLRGGYGFRYDIYCDPATPNHVRNDWEFHGQLLSERYEEPVDGVESVKGFGTSYEYLGWASSDSETKIDWYPFTKKAKLHTAGKPLTVANMKFPANTELMKDADEGGTVLLNGQVMTNNSWGNKPEPWDNHGSTRSNFLFGDGHVITRWWDVKKNTWTKY